MLGIKPGSATCKINTLPTILLLQPLHLLFDGSWLRASCLRAAFFYVNTGGLANDFNDFIVFFVCKLGTYSEDFLSNRMVWGISPGRKT